MRIKSLKLHNDYLDLIVIRNKQLTLIRKNGHSIKNPDNRLHNLITHIPRA